MNQLIIRYQFQDPNPVKTSDLVNLLKQRYGGAVNFIADGTIIIPSSDNADGVFNLLSHLFTFDDKLFVGKLADFQSLHYIRPAITKVAI